jgi:alpha-D-ribose 1-methylphosphonate 5-triphosphate synthase subunit PhnH
MQAASLEGGFAERPVGASQVFRAALDAMSRPGSVQRIKGVAPPAPLSIAAGGLLVTLCDHDTPVWLAPSLAGQEIANWVRFHSGAPLCPRAEATFAFGRWDELLPLTDFAIGTPEYPDHSTTLVVEMPAFGEEHRLTGPGIKAQAHLTLPDPEAMALNSDLYPLGLDFFLICGDRLAALPRTTRIG